MEMTPQAVLTNLKGHELTWDYRRYELSKEEADVIIEALERMIEHGNDNM